MLMNLTYADVCVAPLLRYTGGRWQVVKAGKSLVRVLKNNRETQYLVLQNIATLVQTRPDMFEGIPHIYIYVCVCVCVCVCMYYIYIYIYIGIYIYIYIYPYI